ncbi:MAG: ATP-grasp peptide maturase system methyltransferase [Pseudonocardiaceae bacterium]
MTEHESLRAKFLDELAKSGTVSDPELLAAFRDVPRDVFVPYFFIQTPDQPGWLLVERPSVEWLEGVHSTRALITQIDGDGDNVSRARTSRVDGTATSSSSAPTLMALMLEALNTQDRHRVLEIGTGTGYNTALLCQRLGAANVTSIDIDAGLVNRARERLATLGYLPYLATTDGTQGCPDRAPFDRIIATVGLSRVPEAWIEQTAPGAKILLPLDLIGRAGLLALLTVDGDGKAEGPFLPDIGGFMPIRTNQHHTLTILSTISDDDGYTSETVLPVDQAINTSSPFEFFAALLVGGYDWLGFTPSDGGPAETWLTQPNGSWVCHTTGRSGNRTVRQGGPTRLWDGIEAAHQTWQQLGHPARERFGLTVHHGQHILWLDHPNSPHRWHLNARPSRPSSPA